MAGEDQLSPAGFKGGQGRTAEQVEKEAEGSLWIVVLGFAVLGAIALVGCLIRLFFR